MNSPITFCLLAITHVSKHLVSGILFIRRLCLTVFSQLYSGLLTGALLAVVGAATLLLACGTASAANWDDGGDGDSWVNPGNWSDDTVPTSGEGTNLDNSDTAVLYAGGTGETGNFYPKGTGGGTVDLTIQGTLTTTGLADAQPPVGSASIVTIDGGTWTVTSYSYWKRDATLVVTNGGTFNVNNTGYGFSAFDGGAVKLYDGTMNVGRLQRRSDGYTADPGLIEIGNAGKIVADGNEKSTIDSMVAAGEIVPVDTNKTIYVYFDGLNTIVQAVVPLTLDEQLDRLVEQVHAASMARRLALQEERVASDSVWPYGPMGDTRWALHCLYKNERVAEANERIRAITDVEFPFEKIYFVCADYMQILALFREGSPYYPGRLEASTETLMKDKLLVWARDFEQHWDGFRTETSPDIDPIWKVFASENHELVRKGNNVLIFEILAEDPAYRDEMIMGRPVSWYAQWYNDYTKRWIRARAANGMWMEMGSGYIKYSCALFVNWCGLSLDPELRQLAKMYLDLIFIEEAQTSFKNGNRALTGNRIRTLNSIWGLSNVKGLFYGESGSTGSHNSNYEVTTYQIPALAIWLREYGDEAEPFIINNRLPIETVAPPKYGPDTSISHGATAYIREDSQVFNYVYKTSDYSMGTHQCDLDSDPQDGIGDISGISNQSHQTGILFNDDIPGGGRVMPFMDGLERTYRFPYWTVQNRNLMVSQRTANGGTYVERGMVYISPELTKVETNGWIFVDSGNAWAAVYPLGGYTWGPSTDPEKWPGDFVLPDNDYNPIIYFAGNSQDGYDSFANFQQYVLNDLGIEYSASNDTVVVTRPGEPEFTYYTDYRLPVVNDPDSLYSTTPPLTTAKSYKSPYLNTGSHPQEIIAGWKDRRIVYDFANAEIREVAGTVLDFGGDYVSAIVGATSTVNAATTGDYDFDGAADDTARSVTFGTVWSPTTSGSLTTPVGKSGPNMRYGKSVANLGSTTDPSGGFKYDRIVNYAVPHTVQVSGFNGTGTTTNMSMASAFYYDKADFLNGWWTTGDLAFDATGEISINFSVSRHVSEGRALVRNGADWYLSADALIGAAAVGTLTIFPASSDFYAFNPTANQLLFDTDNPGALVSGATLTNITAIGLHMQHRNYDGTSGSIPYEFFTGFSASIEEPVTTAGWYAVWSQPYSGVDMNLSGDPDFDGINNLVEYGLGGNPTNSDAGFALPTAMLEAGLFSYVYNRRLDAADRGLTYTVEVNTNLLTETWTTDGVSEIGIEDGEAGFESVTNVVPVDANEKFLRLRIEMND